MKLRLLISLCISVPFFMIPQKNDGYKKSLSLVNKKAITDGMQYIFHQGDKKIIINIEQSNITQKQTEAIVNAANEQVWHPGLGGVAKAIFKAAGEKELADEVQQRKLFCPTGQACVTESYNLQAQGVKKIIHAVGPDCRNPGMKCSNGTMTSHAKILLTSAYQNSLALADQEKLTSLSFPFISSAIFGCNKREAAEIALSAVGDYLIDNQQSGITQVDFVLFDKNSLDLFQSLIKRLYARGFFSNGWFGFLPSIF